MSRFETSLSATYCDDRARNEDADEATLRYNDLSAVLFELMRVSMQWPSRTFDLIVLSEVVYYLDRTGLSALTERQVASVFWNAPPCH